MKRMLPVLLLAVLLGTGALSLPGSAMEMDASPCWQASPFLAAYTRSGEASQDVAEIYSLSWEDTQVLAYRATPGTQPEAGAYSLKNLEEVGEISGRLRAVVLGGYPNFSAEELETRANAWLRGRDMPEIESLQTGEALLATQIALWSLTEPAAFSKGEVYSGWKDMTAPGWAGYRRRVQDAATLYQVPAEHTTQNIHSLCAYLESLKPVNAKNNLICDATLAQAGYNATQQEDGTWCVTVEVPLETALEEGTSLTLRALCDGREQTICVKEPQTYSFRFPNLPSPRSVTVTLEGTQQGKDVYLLSAGEMFLMGLARGQIPVRGQITLRPDRILRLRKTTGAADGSLPLANIQFNLYLAATREQLQRAEVSLGPEPTAGEMESIQRAENLVAILSTDENGLASYNFTAGGNPDGTYLVVEQLCTGTTGPVAPFYITIPAEEEYSQEIHLENGLETQPELSLSVTQLGWTEDTFSVNQLQTWYIWASIPAGLAAAKTYTLWDLLPQGLAYEADSAQLVMETGAGEHLRLVPDIHYSIAYEEGELEIALTPAGMAYAAANRGEGDQKPGILVTFCAKLNENAPLGQLISHRARLSYVNGAGVSYSKTSPWAQVQTGGFSIRKTDSGGRPLAGNAYRLARKAGEEEQVEAILNIAGADVPVVFVPFLAEEGIQEETSTDENGCASFSGLSYGIYYLVETKGTGEAPVPIAVDAKSHRSDTQEDRTVRLVSTWGLLPDTGSMGGAVLTAMGFLAVISACFLLVAGRKREY